MGVVDREEFEPVLSELSNLTERINMGKRELTFKKVRLWAGKTPVMHNVGIAPTDITVTPDGLVKWKLYGKDGKRVVIEADASATATVVMRW